MTRRGLVGRAICALVPAGVALAPGDAGAVAHRTQRTVLASWYGARWNGRATASGEIFNHQRLTAASRSLPLGTVLLVTRGDRRVVVRVNDRGPYIGNRGLDLSEAAARHLDMIDQGVAMVRYRVIG